MNSYGGQSSAAGPSRHYVAAPTPVHYDPFANTSSPMYDHHIPPSLPSKSPSPVAGAFQHPHQQQYPNSYSPDPSSPAWSNGENGGSGSGFGSGSGNVNANANANAGDTSRRNPLVDLMDTEKVYVEHLSLVIRVGPTSSSGSGLEADSDLTIQRVAAAWSRKDFPPPKLDAMFRCVEAVYRANRAFGNVSRAWSRFS